MTQDRLTRMKAIVAGLGGEGAVLAAVGAKSRAALKQAYYRKVFPALWFGPMLHLARSNGSTDAPPTDLFGAEADRAWPAVDLTERGAA